MGKANDHGKLKTRGILNALRSEFLLEKQMTVIKNIRPEFQLGEQVTVEFLMTYGQNSSQKNKISLNSSRLSIGIPC